MILITGLVLLSICILEMLYILFRTGFLMAVILPHWVVYNLPSQIRSAPDSFSNEFGISAVMFVSGVLISRLPLAGIGFYWFKERTNFLSLLAYILFAAVLVTIDRRMTRASVNSSVFLFGVAQIPILVSIGLAAAFCMKDRFFAKLSTSMAYPGVKEVLIGIFVGIVTDAMLILIWMACASLVFSHASLSHWWGLFYIPAILVLSQPLVDLVIFLILAYFAAKISYSATRSRTSGVVCVVTMFVGMFCFLGYFFSRY
jgi:hypothetical protein